MLGIDEISIRLHYKFNLKLNYFPLIPGDLQQRIDEQKGVLFCEQVGRHTLSKLKRFNVQYFVYMLVGLHVVGLSVVRLHFNFDINCIFISRKQALLQGLFTVGYLLRGNLFL